MRFENTYEVGDDKNSTSDEALVKTLSPQKRAATLPWYTTPLAVLSTLAGIASLCLGALTHWSFSPLLAFTGFLLTVIPLPLHRLHAALHVVQFNNALGKKWGAVRPLERFAAAAVITLGVLSVLFIVFAPAFIPIVASFFTQNSHLLGIGIKTLLIAGSALLAGVTAIWHLVRVMRASAAPPTSMQPYHERAMPPYEPSFGEIFAAQLQKAHSGRITFGILVGVVLPLLILPSLHTLRPSRLLEPAFVGMTGLTVTTVLLSAFAVITLLTCLTHVLNQRVDGSDIEGSRHRTREALSASHSRSDAAQKYMAECKQELENIDKGVDRILQRMPLQAPVPAGNATPPSSSSQAQEGAIPRQQHISSPLPSPRKESNGTMTEEEWAEKERQEAQQDRINRPQERKQPSPRNESNGTMTEEEWAEKKPQEAQGQKNRHESTTATAHPAVGFLPPPSPSYRQMGSSKPDNCPEAVSVLTLAG